jgi:outer membrane protein OmpA-like peptidoglycan-associated protein
LKTNQDREQVIMGRTPATLHLALVLLVGVAVTPALAQQPTSTGINGWFELNTFHSASGPEDGFGLERAQVLESTQLGLSGVTQIDDDPLTWQRKSGGEYEDTDVEIERLIVLHLNAAIGLFDYAQLGAQIPFYLDRGRPDTSGGVGDARLIPKLAYRWDSWGPEIGVAANFTLSFPSGSPKAFTGEGVVAFEPRLAADIVLGRWRLIGNGGLLIKECECRYDLCRGKEGFGGLGAHVRVLDDSDALKVIGEFTLATTRQDFFGRASTPVELIAGLMYRFPGGIIVSAAGGAGLTPGVGAPDFRLLIGLGLLPRPFAEVAAEEKAAPPEPKDSDGDGLLDAEDFCPEVAEDFDEFDDGDGCPEEDNDEDGLPDTRDRCPLAPENRNGVDDGDGCPENDSDGDRIPDSRDNCPDQEEDLDGVDDGDGCPDLDDDADGVPDAEDGCPQLPESKGKQVKRDGCPDSYRVEGTAIKLTRPLGFTPGKADLTTDGALVLTELAQGLQFNPRWKVIRIRVHSSGKGAAKRNLRLTADRAAEVARMLVSAGVAADRLVPEGVGDAEPLESPRTKEGRAANERVEITIEKGGAQ